MREPGSLPLLLRKATKVFYRYRGFARLAERVRRLFSSYKKPILITDYDGDIRVLCSLNEHIGSLIFWRGYFSSGQLKLLGRLLKPGSVFADVGANQGEFTLFAAKRCTEGLVLAFEPVAEASEKLRKNIALNGYGNVKVFAFGLGDEKRSCPVYSSNALYNDGTRNEGLFTVFPTEQRKDVVGNINIVPLDEVEEIKAVSRLDAVKIDVEGSELAALRGADAVIKKFRPVIFLELCEDTCRAAGYEPVDILKHMQELSYRCEMISDNGETSPMPGDGLLQDFGNIVCYPIK